MKFDHIKNPLQRAVLEGFAREYTPINRLPLGYLSNRGNVYKKRPFGKLIQRDGRTLHPTKGWRD